jgi:hypothetical protein
VEADRRHTATGFKCRKSCSQSCFDLAELVVDGYAKTLKRSGGDVDVARPRRSRNGGLDGLSQVARGAKGTPRHDELSDPASPSLFAVLPNDSLDLADVRLVDDSRRCYRGGGIHPHVERTFSAEAETALVVVDLVAGKTEVEEDQVGFVEAVLGADRAELGKASLDDDHLRPVLGQGHPRGLDGVGIAVDPEQPATGCDPLQDLAGMARLPEGAVDRDRPDSGLEQLYYLL